MKPVSRLHIVPDLPERLAPLWNLYYNLWWTWNQDAQATLQRIDNHLWIACERNPLRFLSSLNQQQLDQLARDEQMSAVATDIVRQFEEYMAQPSWFPANYPEHPLQVAYFSFEFGLTESLRIYSGGLGVLAGDHLKAASDLGVPLVGVGLLYRQGYFHQSLNPDGWQAEYYPHSNFDHMPVQPVRGTDGRPVIIQVPGEHGPVYAQVWSVQVGRVPLYLLETNLEQNRPEDRELTARLYGGDKEMRIRQEVLLGVGGLRALEAVGVQPTICHMNEGHSAFLALERIRVLMQTQGLNFAAAREASTAGNVFTTHTPVAAGNDWFPPDLAARHLEPLRQELGLSRDELLGLGRENPADTSSDFCMTVLALRLSAQANGVSRLHGQVSRRMWEGLWPAIEADESPIGAITNGVHLQSWASLEIAGLYDRYLTPDWRYADRNGQVWHRAEEIPPRELWTTHQYRRQRLIEYARFHLRNQLSRQGLPPARIDQQLQTLDPEALTIGFARRFATYKRGNLLFRDIDRLAAMFQNSRRPLQILFSGKAHPRDNPGKELIRDIVHLARQEPFNGRVFFLQDYDINVARFMVQGCDVWLNNPRRPQEASGTSGMKAALNGVLNVSVMDGWWAEACTMHSGWTIGRGEEYEDSEYQDEVESNSLYDLLESEVVPLFYRRDGDGIPQDWIGRMKESIASLAPYFNTNRMVREYSQCLYLPNHAHWIELNRDPERVIRLTEWQSYMDAQWPAVLIEKVESDKAQMLKVGMTVPVRAALHLGELRPKDVRVELYSGRLNAQNDIEDPITMVLEHVTETGNGLHLYRGEFPCSSPGSHGFTVRVIPWHEDLKNPLRLGLVRWADPE